MSAVSKVATSILDLDGAEDGGEELSSAKEDVYKQREGDDASSSDEEVDDSGTTDKGDDSSDEVSAPQYISLAAGDSSDDDFQDFQKAATATQTHTPQHQHSPVAQALAFVDRQNAPSGSSTSSLLALPTEQEAPYDLRRSTPRDGPGTYAVPPLPPCAPAERLKPLSSADISAIKSAMAGVKMQPRAPNSGSEAVVRRLLGSRVGDEQMSK